MADCAAECLMPQTIPLTSNGLMQLGPMSLGRMDIKYRRVNCKPPVNMMVDVDSSSGLGGWLRMTVKVGLPPAAIGHSLLTAQLV